MQHYKLTVILLLLQHVFSVPDKGKMSTPIYGQDDSDINSYLFKENEVDLTYSDSESEYVPSQNSEDRDFIVSDSEQISESSFFSDQSSETEDDVESLNGVSPFSNPYNESLA